MSNPLTQPERKAINHFDLECKRFFKEGVKFLSAQGLTVDEIWREMPLRLRPSDILNIIKEK